MPASKIARGLGTLGGGTTVFMLIACGPTAEGSHQSLAAVGGDCGLLDVASCEESSSCSVILGTQIAGSGICEDSAHAPVGCMAEATVCTDAIVYASNPSGQIYSLGNGCVPRGWTTLTQAEATARSAAAPRCDERCDRTSPDECAETDGCAVILANEYDSQNLCLHAKASVVGCMPSSTVCAEAIAYAMDSKGHAWRFGNGCIPTGWVGSSQPPAEARDWQACRDR